MKEFLGKDFVLTTETAKRLYHDYAEKMPVFDFHCHLPIKEIYEDKHFRSVTEVWLGGDHYKWRLMREYGVDESYITGDKSDWEKFAKFAEVLPYAVGNPIYVWSHMELRKFFGIYDILCAQTARRIYDQANEKLQTMSARQFIFAGNVKTLFTTDDPVDDLSYHKSLAQDKSFGVVVKPAFRPDKAINAESPAFAEYINKLSQVCGFEINDAQSLKRALCERVEYFDKVGCVCSDHALDVVMYKTASDEQIDKVVKNALCGKLTQDELEIYKGFVLTHLGKEYSKRGWVQQYHIGALRNNSERYMGLLGADTGFDSVEDQPFAKKLAMLLNALDKTDNLPKTILYCLNPRDNEVLAAMINCFQQGGVCGKMQFGSAWWFNDQKDGMTRQLTSLMQVGLVSKFVGMLTDSRSFLSYTRHDYFRRILCELLGGLIENGEYPTENFELLGKIVQDVCYNNAVEYFAK